MRPDMQAWQGKREGKEEEKGEAAKKDGEYRSLDCVQLVICTQGMN